MNFAEHLGAIIKFRPAITFTTNRVAKNGKKLPDGIEIRFGKNKPTEEVRTMLKQNGFQFNERDTKDPKWWAYLNEKTKSFTEKFTDSEVDVDDTQYEKLFFWPAVKDMKEYGRLSPFTEFMVREGNYNKFYNNKRQLENHYNVDVLVGERFLAFKKFYNKAIEESTTEPSNSQTNTEPIVSSKTTSNDHLIIADKLKALADGMEEAIKKKVDPPIGKQRFTTRRSRIASGIRSEGYRMQETQNLLNALSQTWRENEINKFSFLKSIRTKKDVELVNSYKPQEPAWMQRSFDSNKEHFKKLQIYSIYEWSQAYAQIGDIQNIHSPANVKNQNENQKKIEELEREIWQKKIPGFFPTPPDLIKKLIELADIQPDDKILEPSAGKGDILDAIKTVYPDVFVHAIEKSYSLVEILELKGYFVVVPDFLEYKTSFEYDKIIMNPPFENGQDIDHVLHAYNLVKPGGKVVAIMGEGAFFRSFKKDTAFREFLNERSAYVSDTIEEGFKNAFNSTSVRVRIVVLDKPGNDPIPSSNQLELEAIAQIELMKMQLSLKKKGALQGLPGNDEQDIKDRQRKAWALENEWEVLNFK